MTTLKFKTDLNCASCVKAVKPFLDNDDDISDWSVDTDSPEKVLTVTGRKISVEEIQRHVA